MKNTIQYIFTSIFVILLIVLCAFLLFRSDAQSAHPEDYQKLSSGWSASTDGRNFTNIDLQDFTMKQQRARSELIIQTTIHEDKLVENPVLTFYSVHSAFELTLDHQVIYISLFSVFIGFWSLCNYDLFHLFTYDLKVRAYLEFVQKKCIGKRMQSCIAIRSQ